METKICTTIEQSERLIKLGLDKSTADMHYFFDGYNPTRLDVGYDKSTAKFYRGTKNKYMPAWSLSALLNIMPKINCSATGIFYPHLAKHQTGKYICVYTNNDNSGSGEWYIEDTPIDACFEMVVWLIEKGYIKTK